MIKKIKKIIEKIKPKKITFDKIFKKYPILNVMQTKGKAVEGYALFESTKWQKRYSIAFIFLTIILIGVTGFYAFQTYSLNEITSSQFEIENKPLLESLSLKDDLGLGELYLLKVINVGNTPAKIIDAKLIRRFEDGVTATITDKLNYEILPHQEKELKFIDSAKILMDSESFVFGRIEITYIWEDNDFEGTLNRSFYRFEESLHIFN